MKERDIVHTVLTMKPYCLPIVLAEQIVGIHGGILIAKKSPHSLLFLIVDTIETAFCNLTILLYQSLVYKEALYSVLTWILEMLSTHHIVLLHRVGHLECRIHQYTIESA